MFNPPTNARYLLLLLLVVAALTQAQSLEESASTQHLLQRLQGRWQQKYWRDHESKKEYQDVSINWRGAVQEMTVMGKRMMVVEYQMNGRVFLAWGGSISVKDADNIEVTIEYLSPYDLTMVHHAANREASLYSGASVVGSVQSLSASFNQGHLYLTGLWQHAIKNTGYHRPIWIDAGYVKIGDQSLTVTE